MATIPTYPGLAGFPLQFANNGQSFRPDPNTQDTKNLNALGEKIWNESHAVDATLGGAAYGSKEWTYQFVQNGKANAISVPLPFPNMLGWEAYFPKYGASPTQQDFAPGETPFNQCDNYKSDGNLAVADFLLRYSAYRDTDTLPGTVITKAQGVTNVKVEYNQEAQAHGCTTVPFPEAVGATRVAAEAPPTPKPTPKPNTLNGAPLDETGGGYPGNVNAPIPDGNSTAVGGGPPSVFTNPSGPIPNVGMPPKPLVDVVATETTGQAAAAAPTTDSGGKLWMILLIGGALLIVASQES